MLAVLTVHVSNFVRSVFRTVRDLNCATQALELIVRCKVTYDERVALHSVGPPSRHPPKTRIRISFQMKPESRIPSPQSLIPASRIPSPKSRIPNPQSPIPNPQSPIPAQVNSMGKERASKIVIFAGNRVQSRSTQGSSKLNQKSFLGKEGGVGKCGQFSPKVDKN